MRPEWAFFAFNTAFLPYLLQVGRLLGPQGVILQALEANTGTKVTIRGKQSLRKGQKPRPGNYGPRSLAY